jgi:hypothetical protein
MSPPVHPPLLCSLNSSAVGATKMLLLDPKMLLSDHPSPSEDPEVLCSMNLFTSFLLLLLPLMVFHQFGSAMSPTETDKIAAKIQVHVFFF